MKKIIGEKYNKLTIVELCGTDKFHNTLCRCKCDCGNEHIAALSRVKKGQIKSCGCLRKEQASRNFKTHGLRNHPLYVVWIDMRRRCNDSKDCAYKRYGGRGIKVCPEWNNDFKSFYDWAILNGYEKGLSLDRKDNNGNYEPANCRWADWFTQANNKRNNHYFVINGERKTLFQWAKIYNIEPSLILCRIKRGWSEFDAITKPINKKGKKNE